MLLYSKTWRLPHFYLLCQILNRSPSVQSRLPILSIWPEFRARSKSWRLILSKIVTTCAIYIFSHHLLKFLENRSLNRSHKSWYKTFNQIYCMSPCSYRIDDFFFLQRRSNVGCIMGDLEAFVSSFSSIAAIVVIMRSTDS